MHQSTIDFVSVAVRGKNCEEALTNALSEITELRLKIERQGMETMLYLQEVEEKRRQKGMSDNGDNRTNQTAL